MEDLVVKYAFTYGPLMIFFFAVGWAIKSYGPPLFAAWSNMMRETVSALNSASIAVTNSARALDANAEAMGRSMEAATFMRETWEEMRERMDSFHCPATPPVRRRANAQQSKSTTRKVHVKIKGDDLAKAA